MQKPKICLRYLTFISLMLGLSVASKANICGTDYQSFNPTTSGIDFITVHSSETLNPCFMNFGLFFNYSKNVLTYTKDYTDGSGNVFLAGEKPNDTLLGMDLSLGFGLSSNWDIGINIPFVLKQSLEADNLTSSFTANGATEIKISTKYRLSGDDSEGYAVVAGVNQNMIQDNPFTGKNSKPTVNLELVRDWTFGKWATGVNLGYRWRNPGEQIPNIPFEPLKNQFIYSAATSYYFEEEETKLILELFGSQFVDKTNNNSAKPPGSLEWQLGAKKDLSNNVAFHIGGGTSLRSALGSPEARIYTGINWNIGPVCDPQSLPAAEPQEVNQRIKLNTAILFDTDSDVLRGEDIPDLDNFFNHIGRAKISKIVVEGHTDSVGSNIYNLDLSQRRAKRVVRYINEKWPDIQSDRVIPEGYGEEKPIANNGNYQGRMQNRRVELVIEFGAQ